MVMTTWFEKAEGRSDNNPTLRPFKSLLLYDWIEGEEHYRWVANASIEEISDWILFALEEEK